MKKSLIIYCLLGLTFLLSCEKDETRAVIKEDITAPAITYPSDNYKKIISSADSADYFIIRWNTADYGVITPVTYTIRLDSAGKELAGAYILAATTADSLALTFSELNTLLLDDLGLPRNVESVLELQVSASINDLFPVSSEVITMKITPWVEVIIIEEPDALWVPGDYQTWDIANAPTILKIGNSEFEGFINMNTGGKIKFTVAADFDHTVYELGAASGNLSTDPSADSIEVSEPGYYKINVDTTALTYSLFRVESWGIIGTSTEGLWDESTPMTYDEVQDVWNITAGLVHGALKFRADNAWNLDYGPENTDQLIGKLIRTTESISITEAGSYTITIDFSKLEEPYEYKYSVIKN